jgi:hypothetical protein
MDDDIRGEASVRKRIPGSRASKLSRIDFGGTWLLIFMTRHNQKPLSGEPQAVERVAPVTQLLPVAADIFAVFLSATIRYGVHPLVPLGDYCE